MAGESLPRTPPPEKQIIASCQSPVSRLTGVLAAGL